jgi:hypothetical protein
VTTEAQELFLEIARCPVMLATLRGEPTACKKVVLCQTKLNTPLPPDVWTRKHHVPVPWVGHLEEAPLLFLSSNPYVDHSYDESPASDPRPPLPTFNDATIEAPPSLGRPFEAPKYEWEDDQIIDNNEAMYDVWTEPTGRRGYTDTNMALGDASPYWSAAYSFASAAFGHPVRPGHDYALTEIVRCKSRDEKKGVDGAATTCVPAIWSGHCLFHPQGWS